MGRNPKESKVKSLSPTLVGYPRAMNNGRLKKTLLKGLDNIQKVCYNKYRNKEKEKVK